jgi:hypothetical protein
VHFADFVDNTRVKENPFGGCGLASINVRGNTNIPDAF